MAGIISGINGQTPHHPKPFDCRLASPSLQDYLDLIHFGCGRMRISEFTQLPIDFCALPTRCATSHSLSVPKAQSGFLVRRSDGRIEWENRKRLTRMLTEFYNELC